MSASFILDIFKIALGAGAGWAAANGMVYTAARSFAEWLVS